MLNLDLDRAATATATATPTSISTSTFWLVRAERAVAVLACFCRTSL
jgi:hypothetical protein